ncbi:MAG: flagellar hook-basal body complex protein [Xanthobacteraceae bacterium]
MGIFDALTTAVTGLQAQSFSLQNISGNIANSQTVGYKETDTSFEDLVSAAAAGQQTAGGVIANSVATNTVQGSIQSASVSTDMAINGNGWFVVAQPQSFSDNQPVFSGVSDYTRQGDFQKNANGNLVNGAGYYLMGIPVSPTTGNPTGSVPQVLQFSNNNIPAQETSQIQYQLNLPSDPATADTTSSIAGSNLLNPTDFEANPLAGAPTNAAIIGTGATLLPDVVPAIETGTVGGLTNATVVTAAGPPPGGLGLVAGTTISVNDGTNPTTTYTVHNGDTVAAMLAALSTATIHATLNGAGDVVFTAQDDTSSITVGGTAANLTALGLNTTTVQPTNLLTQGAVTQGQTLTVTVTGNPPQTITFGTNTGTVPPQVATLAELQTQVQALAGVTGTLNLTNGNMTLTATSPTAQIAITGTASAAKFGLQTLNALPANGTVIADDASTFTNQSIAGGSVTTYDGTGAPVNVQFRWAKTASVATGGVDTWQLFYQSNSNATGTQAEWTNAGQSFTFNSSGQLTPALTSLTLNNLTVNGTSLGNVQVIFGANGLTQYANTSGASQVNTLQQNGFAAGQLQSLSLDSENRIVGTFSNGQTIPLAQVTLATFNGQNSLQALSGNAYAETADSGPALFSATGQIEGSSLEGSNVDIATQFSTLIVAQQAYSANARVMTTADQMIQSLLSAIQ